MKSPWLTLLFSSFLCLGGCLQGTDTGNPAIDPQDRKEIFGSSGIGRILAEACDVIVRCNSRITLESCLKKTASLTDVQERFGLSALDYPTLQDAIDAEARGDLSPDLSATEACVEEISKLSCSNPLVQDAYQAMKAEAERYSQFSSMIPTTDGSCKDVF